jgi:hypothetical protein
LEDVALSKLVEEAVVEECAKSLGVGFDNYNKVGRWVRQQVAERWWLEEEKKKFSVEAAAAGVVAEENPTAASAAAAAAAATATAATTTTTAVGQRLEKRMPLPPLLLKAHAHDLSSLKNELEAKVKQVESELASQVENFNVYRSRAHR